MSEGRYQSIIDSSHDFITLINRSYVYELVNDTYCDVIEKSKDDLLGNKVEDVWGRELFQGKIKGYLDRCFAGEHVHYIEQFKFGSFMKYMHVSYYPYRENEGTETSHAIVFSHDITQIGQLESKLNHYEYRDPLTGLFNRRSLEVILDKELERADRSPAEDLRVLLFIELIGLEKIVELYSQEIGDLLLENTGRKIHAELRNSDYIFRFEGNRFAVLLSRVADKLDAAKVAEKIHDTVTFPYTFKGNDIVVACSIGAAIYPHDGKNREEIVRNANSAVLEAKRRGRDFILYNAKMHRQAIKRLELESSAFRAVEERQFTLKYQPIVDSQACIVGGESLLRWTHPKMGEISPMEIIPIAEQSGLILAIGKWVLFSVCGILAKWSKEYGIYLSYNMSAREFGLPELASTVRTALENNGSIDPRFLKIEITETTCVADLKASIKRMQSLDELGVKFYIDDFGTGHSSLRYLKELPAEVFKIDRAFVRSIDTDESDRDFLSHIIRMVKSRGREVLAEGIDNARQAELLIEMGCTYMQGFYFSKPLEEKQFEELLRRGVRLPADSPKEL